MKTMVVKDNCFPELYEEIIFHSKEYIYPPMINPESFLTNLKPGQTVQLVEATFAQDYLSNKDYCLIKTKETFGYCSLQHFKEIF